MYNRKAFKREAKERMRESTPHYMLVILVYVLLTTGVTYAVNFLTGATGIAEGILGMFLNLLVTLFGMVMVVGLSYYALNLARRKPTGMGNLFEGFSFAGRAIGVRLLVAIYTFLWSMLGVVVVGVIAGVAMVLSEGAPFVSTILLVVAYIALVVFVVFISLRYAMADFALVENPDGGAGAAIRRSVQMMKGHKGKFFVLRLSFIGWGLLIALIGMAVMAVGVLITGVDWFVSLVSSVDGDAMDAYNVTMEVVGHLSIWTIIAEVVSLPLILWLTAYQHTSFARFYNYVCGYDYHLYMKGDQQDAPSGQPLPESIPVERPEPPTPPGGFYNPAPKLEEDVAAETAEESAEESKEEPAGEPVEPMELEEILEELEESAENETPEEV